MAETFALVLTALPGSAALRGDAAGLAAACLPANARTFAPLSQGGDALEARFSAGSAAAAQSLRDAVAAQLIAHPVDVNVIPADVAGRRKRLLVADMESTIIEQELIDELARRAGLGEVIAAVTARAMRGEIEFEAALRERVARFAGLDARLLDDVTEQVTPMAGAETLIRTLRANGIHCALVSGGFSVFAARVAERLGFDTWQANELEIVDEHLTGRVAEPVLGRAAKRSCLERLAGELGLAARDTMAVGDGANDLDMLATAGLGVAFRAKPAVQAAARATPGGAVVTHGDLTALLYLQGYRDTDFVA